MASPLDISFEHDASIVARVVAGELILVPLTPGGAGKEPFLYTLDDVAAFLWEQMDGRRTGRDLAAVLQKKYEVDPARAEKDTLIFLEELRTIEAIHPVAVK
ncbi:MAG: PqqD family protein [Deltaproteobacteria bacterium]|nr:PqqD family protein [Deltaproteobacteria bacterium]MBI4223801.1 PqqD family protein [Deltaproteobacteria bacterium]